MSLADKYAKLIHDALRVLRDDVPELGYLHRCGTKIRDQCRACVSTEDWAVWILPPLDTGHATEVLFIVGKDPEDWEFYTAYFDDPGEPPALALGW